MATRQERVAAVTQQILDAFQSGTLPAALAQVFIHRQGDRPAARWSWRNRLIAALRGHHDARGFRQWQCVGRCVKRGERAFHILAPVTVKRRKSADGDKDEDAGHVLVGFRTLPVFGYSQTEGEPLETPEELRFIDGLPLVEVARSWGLDVSLFDGGQGPYLGFYHRSAGSEGIALGVENLSTWAHELVHAAEDRLGKLAPDRQAAADEIVAELGGAVLLECLGYCVASDRGGAWSYIRRHSQDAEPLQLCLRLLDRVAAAVEHILDAADALATGSGAAESGAL